MTSKLKPNEYSITRIYEAPVKVVWDAWHDTEKAAKWWGPRGFTITTHKKDLRPGGFWDYTMHGPDGVDYPNKTKYLEVEKESKMVYDHGGNDAQAPLFRVTANFFDLGDKTKLEMTMAFASVEVANKMKKFIKQAGGDATWDRLAEFLSPTDKFVINRSFDAPIDRVFDMWTDPRHLAQWLPPSGFTMKFLKADIKPAGSSFYSMPGGNDVKMYGKAHYREIIKPHLIAYTQEFCDESGKTSRHPMAPTFPETFLTIINLAEEDGNRTRVTVSTEVYGNASDVERETFHQSKAGMTIGWTGSFDKLEEYLNNKL
jgi:uncharacterized protein YndB with AHSA1/START domain